MTLRQWENYYRHALDRTREHIVKRGLHDDGPEFAFFEQCVDQLAVEITLKDGSRIVKGSHCRFTLDEAGHKRVDDNDWVYIKKDGTIYMNTLDGMSPNHFGRVDNIFFDPELESLTNQLDPEPIPPSAQEHYIP